MNEQPQPVKSEKFSTRKIPLRARVDPSEFDALYEQSRRQRVTMSEALRRLLQRLPRASSL
jgi:hypothetical protein